MIKKIKYILAAVCICSAIILLHTFYNPKHSIPASAIENIDDLSVIEIINKVLEDTGRAGDFEAEEATGFSVFYGDVTENTLSDIVIVIKFGNTTLVTIYSRQGSNYVLEADLGLFYNIEGVEFRYIDNLLKEGLFVREKVDLSLGGFETNEFIRGYAFVDGVLVPILSVPTDIEAYWHESFPGIESEEDIWTKISQQSSVSWVTGNNPEVILVKNQNISNAEGMSTERIPDADEFNIGESRAITERYVWSDKWQRFILYERVYGLTGGNVAVLEDLSTLPYSLAGLESNKSRVIFENGDIEVVDNSDLS